MDLKTLDRRSKKGKPHRSYIHIDGSMTVLDDAQQNTILEATNQTADSSIFQKALDRGSKIIVDEGTYHLDTPVVGIPMGDIELAYQDVYSNITIEGLTGKKNRKVMISTPAGSADTFTLGGWVLAIRGINFQDCYNAIHFKPFRTSRTLEISDCHFLNNRGSDIILDSTNAQITGPIQINRNFLQANSAHPSYIKFINPLASAKTITAVSISDNIFEPGAQDFIDIACDYLIEIMNIAGNWFEDSVASGLDNFIKLAVSRSFYIYGAIENNFFNSAGGDILDLAMTTDTAVARMGRFTKNHLYGGTDGAIRVGMEALKTNYLQEWKVTDNWYDAQFVVNGNAAKHTEGLLFARNHVRASRVIVLNYCDSVAFDDNFLESGITLNLTNDNIIEVSRNKPAFAGATWPTMDLTGSTLKKVRDNIHYITRNGGQAASIADGGTINHGLVTTPTYAIAVPTGSANYAQVTALGATTITIGLKNQDGNPGTTQSINWMAEYLP